MLGILVDNGPSPTPVQIWELFPQLYRHICGSAAVPGIAQAVEPSQDCWAPDCVKFMLEPLEKCIVRGPPDTFLAGNCAQAGLTYPEMLFAMFRKVLVQQGKCAEEDCAAGAQLAGVLFASVPIPKADSWLAAYFGELWERLQHVETALLKRSIFRSYAVMLWYNSAGFLQCAEEKGCSAQLFDAWMRNIGLFETLGEKKALVLGLLRMLQLASAQGLPASVAPGLPHVLRALASQTKEIARLREKQAAAELAEGDGEPGEDRDSDDEALASTGGLMDRSSVLDGIDELCLLRDALQQAPSSMAKQIEAWLGAAQVASWGAELEREAKLSAQLHAKKEALCRGGTVS